MACSATVRVLEVLYFKQWFHDVTSKIKNNVDEGDLNLDNAKNIFG